MTAISVFAAIWSFANAYGLRARGRRRGRDGDPGSTQRRGDTRSLRGAEKRLYNESQRLLTQGKVAAAARILEQLNMPREAIQALEDHGLVHEAAKILMRMQRHNRAGVIYARHGMWESAAGCFKLANMPLEVAKCAREAGDLATAAEFFDKVGRFEDAGECHEALGDFHRAARYFVTAGQKPRAMGLYNRLAAAAENLAAIPFEDAEVQHIVDYLGDGHADKGLADVVVNRNRLPDALLRLVGKGLVKQAAELLGRSTNDVGPMLMADVSYQTRAAGCLAEVFHAVNQPHYAGMVLERMSAFDRAGEAFERAEDYERAAYCYERAGIDFKARSLKEKARRAGHASGSPAGRGGFALASVQTRHDTPAFPDPASDGEKTSLLDASGRAAPVSEVPPAPLPPPPSFSLRGADDTAPSEPPPAPVDTTPSARPAASQVDPLVDPFIDSSARESAVGDEGRAAFHQASFFGDLDFDQKNKLWAIGSTRSFRADEPVLTYNDEPKGVYVIIQGSVSCYRQVGGKEAYVDQMGESESFGELWLLADQPTAVRFVASKNTRIRVIDRDPFNDLLDRDGLLARKLYKRFTMRLLKRLLKPQTIPQGMPNKGGQQAS